MEHAHPEIELSNPLRPELAAIRVRARAETATMVMRLPEQIARRLELKTAEVREVAVADGRKLDVPYVGPIRVTFGKRGCFVGAIVIGDDVLLGAVPMEDMDLVISPDGRSVTVNPESPDIPRHKVKVCGRRAGRMRRAYACTSTSNPP